MNFPKELSYTKDHEWVKFNEDGTALVGLTDYAQHSLGDIVYLTLPQAGDSVTAGASFAEVESVKAVSEVFSPVGGRIQAVNEALNDAPEQVNNDPYGAWLISVSDVSEKGELLTCDAYAALCG
jgi:glycine cleavage system H protein